MVLHVTLTDVFFWIRVFKLREDLLRLGVDGVRQFRHWVPTWALWRMVVHIHPARNLCTSRCNLHFSGRNNMDLGKIDKQIAHSA